MAEVHLRMGQRWCECGCIRWTIEVCHTCRERIEARRAETGNTGSVHESRVSVGNLAHPPAIQEQS